MADVPGRAVQPQERVPRAAERASIRAQARRALEQPGRAPGPEEESESRKPVSPRARAWQPGLPQARQARQVPASRANRSAWCAPPLGRKAWKAEAAPSNSDREEAGQTAPRL